MKDQEHTIASLQSQLQERSQAFEGAKQRIKEKDKKVEALERRVREEEDKRRRWRHEGHQVRAGSYLKIAPFGLWRRISLWDLRIVIFALLSAGAAGTAKVGASAREGVGPYC